MNSLSFPSFSGIVSKPSSWQVKGFTLAILGLVFLTAALAAFIFSHYICFGIALVISGTAFYFSVENIKVHKNVHKSELEKENINDVLEEIKRVDALISSFKFGEVTIEQINQLELNGTHATYNNLSFLTYRIRMQDGRRVLKECVESKESESVWNRRIQYYKGVVNETKWFLTPSIR